MTTDEITWLLEDPADRRGECDCCHEDNVQLWWDRDSDGCGDWELCRPCWLRAAKMQIRRDA